MSRHRHRSRPRQEVVDAAIVGALSITVLYMLTCMFTGLIGRLLSRRPDK